MKPSHLERIEALPDVFMLASLVQFKYVQTISESNDSNFVVGMAGGYEVFGTPEQYDAFMNKYLNWLESR
jgi:small nuclear ribonucleoprotein (snRNP)-like protein